MKLFFLFLLFLFSLPILALTGGMESSVFTIDTIEPELILVAFNGGEAWYIGGSGISELSGKGENQGE